MKIYRVIATEGVFVGVWHTTRRACKRQIEELLNNPVSCLMFGEDYTIEWAYVEVD